MRFFLGTHQPSWLATAGVPLFVSRRRLAGRRSLPRATATWALDSGGFTELSLRGAWSVTAREYADEARRFSEEIGRLEWAAPQDWMCEPFVLAKTGLTIAEHQQRTVDSLLELRALEPSVHWIPVLQGWGVGDYFDCLDQYDRAGIDLRAEPVVGVGSVCRRQGMTRAHMLIRELHDAGLRLHAFGFKLSGLRSCGHLLASADSMAWSFDARRSPPMPGCVGHINCANCLRYALQWRDRVLGALASAEAA